jgi:hypothetical protein
MSEFFFWRKMKKNDIPYIEDLLCDMEKDCVGACGRFIIREPSRDNIWVLASKTGHIRALTINSKSTVMPILCGMNDVPRPNFLGGFLRLKRIHSIQGFKNDVGVFEEEMKRTGKKVMDIFDYDLMETDMIPDKKHSLSGPDDLVLRFPRMVDLDVMAPLQAAYEQEEVLPQGSVFSYAASRINLANIIANGKILIAELKGRVIGKINVSAVSYSRYQVGGVYVHPDFRGKGVARRMASEFIASLVNEGKGVTLYVKKSNAAAKRLYAGLGFNLRGDYRITYY